MQRVLIYYLLLFTIKYHFSSAVSDLLLNYCVDELTLIGNKSSGKEKEQTQVPLVADIFVTCDLTMSGEWTKQQLLREVAEMLKCEELVDESLMSIKMITITIPKIFETAAKNEENENDNEKNNISEFTRVCYFSPALDPDRPIYIDANLGVTYDHRESNQQQREQMVLLHARVVSASHPHVVGKYRIQLERRHLTDSMNSEERLGRRRLPELPRVAKYRRLPELNVHFPSDIFYPFSCTTSGASIVRTTKPLMFLWIFPILQKIFVC